MPKQWKVSEIEGFEVFDTAEKKLGVLKDVLRTGSNDVWAVETSLPNAPEILIPALNSVIIDVNIDAKKITVDLPQGLKEVYEVKVKGSK
ncbi:ribosome maturation factor RimM [Elusimicrobiota bacterium]